MKNIFKFFFMLICLSVCSCNWFNFEELNESSTNQTVPEPETVQVKSIKLSTAKQTIKVGEIFYLGVTITPSDNVDVSWTYDDKILSVEKKLGGVVVTGIKEGQSSITCTAGNKSSTAVITVSGFADNYSDAVPPYIYSSTSVLTMSVNQTEKVCVSLFNGSVADNESYTWTVDNSSVATLAPTGQYCQINAVNEGYTQIKVTNGAAAYPYYIGVYVFLDANQSTYLTTKTNVVSISKTAGDTTIYADVVNPSIDNYKPGFTWEIEDGGNEYFSITSNADKCIITPIKAGLGRIKVTNTLSGAYYPLEITVRIVEIVDNVYIQPNTTVATITGDDEVTITSTLIGITEGADYSNDDFVYKVDNTNIVSFYSVGNQITFRGLRNGSTNLYISHPCSAKSRQVLLIVEGQKTDAVDSSCYITTSQNYIKTKVGEDEIVVRIMLKGGNETDADNYTWSVIQQPEDNVSNVISLTTSFGTTNSVLKSRQASNSFNDAYCYIKPLSEGTATIKVQNTKCYYPTEILVKVLSEDANLEEPKYFKGPGIVKFLNSETYKYDLEILNGKTSDASNNIWSVDNSYIHLNANGNEAEISSTAVGSTISNLTIKNKGVETDKKVLVLTADTLDELNNISALYSDKTSYSINVGKYAYLTADCVGFGEDFDWNNAASQVIWTSSNPQIASVEKKEGNPLIGIVTGNRAGTCTVTVNYQGVSTSFTVIVYPEDVIIDQVETNCYISTSQNVLVLSDIGASKQAFITVTGIPASELHQMEWKSEDEGIAKVIGNGDSATIIAVNGGETRITVSHPLSENTLTIYVRVGSEYIVPVNPVVYITANTDVIVLKKDSSIYNLKAYLMNGTEEEKLTGFTFECENSTIANIVSQFPDGRCYIKPVFGGQTEIKIKHTATAFEKTILVIVGNTDEELAQFQWLTTSSNVITMSEGSTKSVNVNIENSTSTVLDGFTWYSNSPAIAQVSSTSAGTALITANGIGTTTIKVSNENCTYPLEIIVQVVSAKSASMFPYIQTPTPILNLTTSSTWSTVTADLVGGTSGDAANFTWTPRDKAILEAYGQNGVGKVRAKTAGITYLTISHPKAIYDQEILCICEDPKQSDCSISVSCGNILSLKPTDSDKTITASLVNGSTTDKYNFKFQLDVYDVVDMVYSANSCVITPLKEGTCTLTVSHPKSAYNQSIVIKVQQFDKFSFASKTKTIIEGKTSFITMQVPASNIDCYVEYISQNTRVCSITGTDQVCQITGVAPGTTTVTANLVSTTTGVVQATSNMLVSIEEKDTTQNFITGSSSIYTMEVGTNKIFSANISGSDIVETDQYNLKWKSSNPEILKLTGVSTSGYATGSQVYGEALSPGECTLTVSHEKSNTELVYYIIVPRTTDSDLTLSKTYIKMTQYNSVEISATIHGGDTSNSAYKNIIWSALKYQNDEIVKVNGSGKSVTIYAIAPGITEVLAQLPNGSVAKCQIEVEAEIFFTWDKTTTGTMIPGEKKKIKFEYSPASSILTFKPQSTDGIDYFAYEYELDPENPGYGEVKIECLQAPDAGSRVAYLMATTNKGASATLNVPVSWCYSFNLNSSTKIKTTPDKAATQITYSVSPKLAVVQVEYSDNSFFEPTEIYHTSENENGKFILAPQKEGLCEITIKATNPVTNYTFAEKTITFESKYESIEITTQKVKSTKHGSSTTAYWSKREDDVTYQLGDGEDLYIQLNLSVPTEKLNRVSYSIINEPKTSNVSASIDSDTGLLVISSTEDQTAANYYISEGYSPYYNGSRVDPFTITNNFQHDGPHSYHSAVWAGTSTRIRNEVFSQYAPNGIPLYGWRIFNCPTKISANKTRTYYTINVQPGSWAASSDPFEANKGISKNPLKKTGNNDGDWGEDYKHNQPLLWDGWVIKRDTSIDGYHSVEKVENSMWFFTPTSGYVNYGEDDKHPIGVACARNQITVFGNKISYQNPTHNTSVVDSKTKNDTVKVNVYRMFNGQKLSIGTITINAKLQIRNCACTYH